MVGLTYPFLHSRSITLISFYWVSPFALNQFFCSKVHEKVEMQGKQVSIEEIPMACTETIGDSCFLTVRHPAFSSGPSCSGRIRGRKDSNALWLLHHMWHLLLFFGFSEMGVEVVGKQQATSFPTPIQFLQWYQITAGVLNLAHISLRCKAVHFPKLHSTIFVYLFFLCVFFSPLFSVRCVLCSYTTSEPGFS